MAEYRTRQTNPAASEWRTTLALALAHAGHFEEAGAVADDEIALARAFGAPTALARALHARCIAEPELDERAALATAVLAVPTPATLLHASARIELGVAQLRRGHRGEASEALEAAAAVADAADARPMADRGRRALAACARDRHDPVAGTPAPRPPALPTAAVPAANLFALPAAAVPAANLPASPAAAVPAARPPASPAPAVPAARPPASPAAPSIGRAAA